MSDDASNNSRGTISDIYTRFAELHRESKANAYRFLHEALSTHAAELVPAVIPLKDFNSLLMDLETFLKGSVSASGKTPNEYLADWLNGDDSATPPAPIPEKEAVN